MTLEDLIDKVTDLREHCARLGWSPESVTINVFGEHGVPRKILCQHRIDGEIVELTMMLR